MSSSDVEQARNELAEGKRLGNRDAVIAAEKRLAAHGAKAHDEQRKATPVEASPSTSRHTTRSGR